jgi:hypothetical protein
MNDNLNLGRLGGQLGVALCLLGFLVLFLGWNGMASQDYVPAQLPYLVSAGATGLGIVVFGSAMVVVQNQRADRARLEALLQQLVAASERQGSAPGHAAHGGTAPGGLGGYVVAGEASYHRLDCALPEARTEARLVPLEDVVGGSLEPCRVCRPPQLGRLLPQA